MPFGTALVAGHELPWYLPVAILVLLATVVTYVCGLLGTRGPALAVWPIIGGALVLFGVFVVQLERDRPVLETPDEPAPDTPDQPAQDAQNTPD